MEWVGLWNGLGWVGLELKDHPVPTSLPPDQVVQSPVTTGHEIKMPDLSQEESEGLFTIHSALL